MREWRMIQKGCKQWKSCCMKDKEPHKKKENVSYMVVTWQSWKIPKGAGSRSVNGFTDANLHWQALNKKKRLDGEKRFPSFHSV